MVKVTSAIFFSLGLSLGLSSCSDSNAAFSGSVLNVSDFAYTKNNLSAVSITFGDSIEDYCDLTLLRKDVVNGFSENSIKRSNPNFSLECQWGGKTYLQSNKHDTFANLKIIELSDKDEFAKFNISFKSVNVSSDKYLEAKNFTFEVKGGLFDNLMMNI